MRVDVVIGGMYGDEGKGKIVNYLVGLKEYDFVFRVNASTNASHCVKLDNSSEIFVTKQLPSVFFNDKTIGVIAPGALLNIEKLKEELLERPDIKVLMNKVFIASNIPLIIQPYIDVNVSCEHRKNIGSTNQGTGIGVQARTGRHCLYLYDIKNYIDGKVSIGSLINKVMNTCRQIHFEIDSEYVIKLVKNLIHDYLKIQSLLGNEFCVDYTNFLSNIKKDATILIEGCNGILLDNIHGVHPYTTSMSTSINSLLNGANLSPYYLRDSYVILGVYSCCLNKRPFITEMDENTANKVFANNEEIDNAEGMRRRIGWLDLVAIRKALIGHTGCKLVINKTDVLKDFETIKVCTSYTLKNGDIVNFLPDNTLDIKDAIPNYVELDGWTGINNSELPKNLEAFIKLIEAETGFNVKYIGTGQRTSDIIENWGGEFSGSFF